MPGATGGLLDPERLGSSVYLALGVRLAWPQCQVRYFQIWDSGCLTYHLNLFAHSTHRNRNTYHQEARSLRQNKLMYIRCLAPGSSWHPLLPPLLFQAVQPHAHL